MLVVGLPISQTMLDVLMLTHLEYEEGPFFPNIYHHMQHGVGETVFVTKEGEERRFQYLSIIRAGEKVQIFPGHIDEEANPGVEINLDFRKL